MVSPTSVHLPNGQTLTVSPIFGGMYIRSNELTINHHHDHCPFPPGWTVVLNTEEVVVEESHNPGPLDSSHSIDKDSAEPKRRTIIHPYRKPTLQSDHLFISSISQPPSTEFKPASSPARQIAMMLWATLYWYFQQPEPEPYLQTPTSAKTPTSGKPKGEWRIRINREGIFKSRVILPKLERMGLIASLDSAVGVDRDERAGDGWLEMFVSRKSFWQLDARIYLFTLAPGPGSPYMGGTPVGSRPGSPTRHGDEKRNDNSIAANVGTGVLSGSASPGPFHSTSHLPTYYPPPPPQFTYTNDVRHPVRPKPGKQGDVLYTRFVPSVGQYLSFRIAAVTPHSSMAKPILPSMSIIGSNKISLSDSALPTVHSLNLEDTDIEILHRWMNEPRVSHFWGEQGPSSRQEAFLKNALRSKHSIPLIGCWDGKPFGYFEVYWVKEDPLGRLLGDAGNYDRGIHCLVGEQEFRGPHRVKIWLSSLLHYCWLVDNRTEVVMMEPRVDNQKLLNYCLEVGFYKEKEITFHHKQSNLLKAKRDGWDAPAL